MIQADIHLCCTNIDQTFAVLFVEVAFVLIVVLQMVFVCICVFCSILCVSADDMNAFDDDCVVNM